LKKILVTGANGFLGRAISSELLVRGYDVVCAVRRHFVFDGARIIRIAALEEQTDWEECLDGIDCIIHTAARAHFFNNTGHDPYQDFHKINVVATLNLAQQAALRGIKRFIFISSIAVNGNQNSKPFLETDKPNPQGAYAVSKFEAEQSLIRLCKKTGLELVIIRPPLVYGPQAPGNFGSLLRWVRTGLPLPLGIVGNKRSLVALDNLVSFIQTCIDHPKAANELFLISDGEDVSTTELINKTAQAFGKRPMLIPVPVSLMKLASRLIGREDIATRLFGSLQVDSSKARELLAWKPVISMDGQLQKIADTLLNEKTV
jgi:nucleoside-diphosphate-sugar epimerase